VNGDETAGPGARPEEESSCTDLTLTTGERLRVTGSVGDVEATVVAASRGSIMQMAWLQESATGRRIAVNPRWVVTIAAADPAGER